MFLKKGIKVKVLTGKDKGKDGEIIQIDRSRDLAKVKSLNMIKKHKKYIYTHTTNPQWITNSETDTRNVTPSTFTRTRITHKLISCGF